MNRQRWGLCGVGLAVVVVGLVALGVPVSTVLFVAVVLACPLMMLFMHGGHGGGHAGEDQHGDFSLDAGDHPGSSSDRDDTNIRRTR